MRRLIWTALLYVALVEIFSVLPTRTPVSTNRPRSYLSGAIHFPVFNEPAALDRLSQDARLAGLDFVVLANLDQVFPDGVFGTRNGVDLFPETEVSTPAGHALLFYSQTSAAGMGPEKLKEIAWNHFLGTQSRPGLFLVIAHPSGVFHPWDRLDRFPEGIELINLRSLVERRAFNNPFSFAMSAAMAPFNPFLATLRLYEPDARDLQGWDAMNAVSPGHFGVLATDEVSLWPVLGRLGIPLPPWTQTLSATSNIVFPEGAVGSTPRERRAQIYRAIRDGRSALLLHAIHPFDGNDFALVCGKKEYRSGDKFALREAGCEFVVRTPATLQGPKRLILYRDGRPEAEIASAADVERFPLTHDGAYRVEVRVQRHSLLRILLNQEVPYLIYNPLYVR